jgi:DNA-binding HxlR family transcriptional regulator
MKPSHRGVTPKCKPVFDVLPEDVCHSVGDVLERVGDKWSILVIYALSLGGNRFSELKRKLGSISQKVLTSTLRGLERDGYVTRSVVPTSPPRVDYSLTPLGQEVLAPVMALAMWAFERRREVEASRRAFDKRAEREREGSGLGR